MNNRQQYNLIHEAQTNLRLMIETQRQAIELLQREQYSRSYNRERNRYWSNTHSNLNPWMYIWPSHQNQRQNMNRGFMNNQTHTNMNSNNDNNIQEQIENATTSGQFSEVENPLNIMECPISHQEFQPNTMVSRFNLCNHMFCQSSINTWLQNNQTCPVCRRQVIQHANRTNNNQRHIPFTFFSATVNGRNVFNENNATNNSDEIFNSLFQNILNTNINPNQNNHSNENQTNDNDDNNADVSTYSYFS